METEVILVHCTACVKEKPIDEFYNKEDALKYRIGYCKKCTDRRRERDRIRKINSNWYKAVQKFDGKCALCGDKFRDVHHIIPLSRGGHDNLENLVPLCRTCHVKAHNGRLNGTNGYNTKIFEGIV